ncbi:DUF6731 family protein [Lacticaseibacillus paracasei]|uniref:DUF6731 family protein n=1 Tax=Lacticaseibacillus paracasei TaxID=1597 RepID=UPI00336AF5F3
MAKKTKTQEKKVNFDFFQVWSKTAEEEKVFDIDDWVEKLPSGKLEERNIRYNGDIIRCDNYYVTHPEKNPFTLLHFTRLRNSSAPAVASINVPELNDVDLKEDEYIAEDVSSLFDYTNSVLMFQRNAFSLSITSLAQYVNYFWNRDRAENESELIEFRPILRKDAFKAGLGTKHINKFSFKTANIVPGSGFKLFQGALGSTIDAMEKYSGVSIEVTISTRQSKKSVLDRSEVVETIKAIQQQQSLFKKATVVSGDSGKSVPIELINGRVETSQMFNVPLKAYLDPETVQQDMNEIYSPDEENFKATVDKNLNAKPTE